MDYALPENTVLDMAKEVIDKALENGLDMAVTAGNKADTNGKSAYYVDFIKRKMEKQNKQLIKMFGIELCPTFDLKKKQMHITVRNHETKEKLKEVICYDEAWH